MRGYGVRRSCVKSDMCCMCGEMGMLHMRQVAGDDQTVIADECFPCGADTLLAVFSEWNIRCACVPPVERPFCFAMTDDEYAWIRHGGIDASWREQLVDKGAALSLDNSGL